LSDTISQNDKDKKIAISVGINKYYDDEEDEEGKGIPRLDGAENDAKEFFELLTSETAGFENDTENLLLGENATHRKITERVADIFRENKKFEMALFYFSGHGFVDKKGDLYLSTYDVSKKDPYIGGINVDDLRDQIYKSENKNNAIMILDCCYSGAATKGAKEGSKNLIPVVRQKIENTQGKNYGAGKFTIASSAASKVSWEKADCKHSDKDIPHVHGEFTYHLLEGLSGGAADGTSGEITLLSLQQYIDNKLAEKEQTSSVNISEATNLYGIRIALSVNTYRSFITGLEEKIQSDFPLEDLSFPSIRYIINGAQVLKNLKEKNPDNPKIRTFTDTLSSKLSEFKDGLITWCSNLPNDVQTEIEYKTAKRSIDLFVKRVSELELESVGEAATQLAGVLNVVGMEVESKQEYKNAKDPKFLLFLTRLLPAYKTYNKYMEDHKS
jgi:caspase domain-containing protein